MSIQREVNNMSYGYVFVGNQVVYGRYFGNTVHPSEVVSTPLKRNASIEFEQNSSPKKQYRAVPLPTQHILNPIRTLQVPLSNAVEMNHPGQLFIPIQNGRFVGIELEPENDAAVIQHYIAEPTLPHTETTQFISRNNANAVVLIKKLIETEDKSIPFSDRKLKLMLNEIYEISISRRTVTQIRNELGFSDSLTRRI